jgi:dipeptide/tripeptide permease
MIKRLLISNLFYISLTIISIAAGFTLSILNSDFNWLSRFGALVICWGILLLARPSLTGKEIGQHITAHDSELSVCDPEYYKRKNENVPGWVVDNVTSRRAVGVFGPLICFIGTLINGFGSLLNQAFGFTS